MLENEVILKECNKLDFLCFHYELCLMRDYFFIPANYGRAFSPQHLNSVNIYMEFDNHILKRLQKCNTFQCCCLQESNITSPIKAFACNSIGVKGIVPYRILAQAAQRCGYTEGPCVIVLF